MTFILLYIFRTISLYSVIEQENDIDASCFRKLNCWQLRITKIINNKLIKKVILECNYFEYVI